ncbi:MAG: hypothetical protein LBL45_13270 [Treponema sp.]|jgi:IS30 family transposase|nr:hypothetical protein [Treponema sp.]
MKVSKKVGAARLASLREGEEMVKNTESENTATAVYFCHPHSLWEVIRDCWADDFR